MILLINPRLIMINPKIGKWYYYQYYNEDKKLYKEPYDGKKYKILCVNIINDHWQNAIVSFYKNKKLEFGTTFLSEVNDHIAHEAINHPERIYG